MYQHALIDAHLTAVITDVFASDLYYPNSYAEQ
jgi:hypothetical protein